MKLLTVNGPFFEANEAAIALREADWEIVCYPDGEKWIPAYAKKHFDSAEAGQAEFMEITGIDPDNYCECCGPDWMFYYS